MGKLSDYQKLTAQLLSPAFFKEEQMDENETSAYIEKYKRVFELTKLRHVSERFESPVESGIAVSKIATGFKYFDIALGGGIGEGEITAISGPPGVGKSTFALQFAENLSKNDIPILYFSYEMSAERVAAKSISRSYFLMGGKKDAISAMELMDLKNWKGGGKFTARNFLSDYKKAVSDVNDCGSYIFFFDCTVEPLSIDDIGRIVNNYIEVHQKKPVVFIDYLHMIPSPKDADGADLFGGDKAKIDYNMSRMRAIVSIYKCSIVFISALRKEDFKVEADMAGLMGSSSIAYNCDAIFGLQFGAVDEKGFDIHKEQGLHPRRIEAVVIKSRYCEGGRKVRFDYFNKWDYFDDSAEKRGWKSSGYDKEGLAR